MKHELAWKDLKGGLTAFVCVVGVAAAVLIFARVGGVRGSTATLYMVTNKAAGVMEDSEVWLGGQKAGTVSGISFRPAESDTSERVSIELKILKKHFHHIRRDSDVQIRPGTSLIGEPVIYVTVGSQSAPALREGDTLRARAQIENRATGTDLINVVSDSVAAIGRSVKQIVSVAGPATREITQLRRKAEQQAHQISGAIRNFREGPRKDGSLALLASDSAMYAALSSIAATSDSIRALLAVSTNAGSINANSADTHNWSAMGSLGRFRADSTLGHSIQNLVTTLKSLEVAYLSARDSSSSSKRKIMLHLDRTRLQLDSLVQDAKKHPIRYLPL